MGVRKECNRCGVPVPKWDDVHINVMSDGFAVKGRAGAIIASERPDLCDPCRDKVDENFRKWMET